MADNLFNGDFLKKTIVSKVREWADVDPNQVFLGLADDSGRELTRKDIAEEVAEETDFGQKFAQGWFELALEQISSIQVKPPTKRF